MKNAEYWKKRFMQLEERSNRTGSEASAEIEKQYRQAQKEIEEKILLWYKRLAGNNNISFADAKKFLKTSELEEFKWDVQDYIKYGRENSLNQKWIKELENASAKYHISYYETLKIETRQSFEKLFQKVFEATRDSMKKVYEDSYFRTAYEVQKGLNLGWSLQGLDQNKIEKAILKPWAADGKVFSDRIWSDKDKLISELNSELTRMAVTGDSPDRAAENIAKKLKTSKNNAWRIVQTESSAMHAASQQDCYKDLGVEEFEVSETLDKHTCETCGEMDGQHFPLSEYIIGLTAPPFHPRCRGCTCPYFEDDLGERIARDVKTGAVYYLPSNTTYKQWKEMQDAKYGSDAVDTARNIAYNESADKKQYQDYKSRLGADAPETFEAFQNIKYDYPTEYQELCGLYSYKGRVPEATAADYIAYKAVKATGIIGSVRVPPKRIDTKGLSFNDNHASRHGCTLEQAVGYINTAKCSVTRKRWDGYHTGFYSKDGAAYVADDTNKIKTAFSKKDFDETAKAVMEVFK